VFFSTGTDVQQNIFSKETKLNFANAFRKLVQKTVIWKDNIDDEDHPFHDQPSNILIHKWVPQNEVLGKPKTPLKLTENEKQFLQHFLCALTQFLRNISFTKPLGAKLSEYNLV